MAYLVHRGKRFKCGRAYSTREQAERVTDKSKTVKALLKQGKKVSIVTVKIDKGRNKGKYTCCYRVL